MSGDSLRDEKRRVRKHCLAVRRGLSDGERAAVNAEMAGRLLELPEYLAAEGLLIYASMPDEPDTLRIVREALRAGKRVAFPVCLPETSELAFYEVASVEELKSGLYGILEPPSGAREAAPNEFSLCVVPGAGFDREGYRIGLGKGYYDRFLSVYRGFTVGLVFSGCLLPRVPREPHDRRVDAVITERELLRTAGK